MLLFVADSNCYVPLDIKWTYNKFQMVLHGILGMLLPYSLVAIFNALIVLQMIKYRSLRADLSANADNKAEENNQR